MPLEEALGLLALECPVAAPIALQHLHVDGILQFTDELLSEVPEVQILLDGLKKLGATVEHDENHGVVEVWP